MSLNALSPTSVGRNSPAFSPTSVFNAPTAVGYVPAPVNPNPSLKVDTSPSAHLNPAKVSAATSNAAALNQTLAANASQKFLTITMPDGSTVYAEYGRVVPQARFQNDMAAAGLSATLQQNKSSPFAQIQTPNGIVYAENGVVVSAEQFTRDLAASGIAQTLKQNASQSFVQIQTDSGIIYAEKGVQVSAAKFQQDLQNAQAPNPKTLNLFSKLSLNQQANSLSTLSELIANLKAELGSSPSSDRVNAYNQAVNTYNQETSIYNAGANKANAASQAQASAILSLSGQTLSALTLSQYLNNEGVNQPTITVNGKSMTLSQYAQQNPSQKFAVTATKSADGTVNFSLKSTTAPAASAPKSSPVESASATAYNDITAGFTDLFRAGVSTGIATRQAAAKVGIGKAPPKGTQPSDLSLLGFSEAETEQFAGSTAGYLFPGAAVLKGIGSPGEGTGARLFDIGVGVLPFLPLGDVAGVAAKAGGKAATVAKFGTSFAGRTLIGSGFGAVGGLAYGEDPLQIGESALLGGLFGGPGGSIASRVSGRLGESLSGATSSISQKLKVSDVGVAVAKAKVALSRPQNPGSNFMASIDQLFGREPGLAEEESIDYYAVGSRTSTTARGAPIRSGLTQDIVRESSDAIGGLAGLSSRRSFIENYLSEGIPSQYEESAQVQIESSRSVAKGGPPTSKLADEFRFVKGLEEGSGGPELMLRTKSDRALYEDQLNFGRLDDYFGVKSSEEGVGESTASKSQKVGDVASLQRGAQELNDIDSLFSQEQESAKVAKAARVAKATDDTSGQTEVASKSGQSSMQVAREEETSTLMSIDDMVAESRPATTGRSRPRIDYDYLSYTPSPPGYEGPSIGERSYDPTQSYLSGLRNEVRAPSDQGTSSFLNSYLGLGGRSSLGLGSGLGLGTIQPLGLRAPSVLGLGLSETSILGLGQATQMQQLLGVQSVQATVQATQQVQTTETTTRTILEEIGDYTLADELTTNEDFSFLPPLQSDVPEQPRRSRKRTVYKPTKVRNRIALNIAGSFGDVAEDLLGDMSSGLMDFGAEGILGGLF
jgi:hypothetical protein